MLDMVQRRRWMTEAEFLTGLAMSQALPGGMWSIWRSGSVIGLGWQAAGLILSSCLTLFLANAGRWLSITIGMIYTALVMTRRFNPLLLIGAGAAVYLGVGG
jgi:chromate transport protein ChrA